MSLSIDMTGILTQAEYLFNALWPVLIIPLGFTFGIGILGWIFNKISNVFSFKG